MAKFKVELPNDVIKEIDKAQKQTPKMMGEMTEAGAKIVYQNVLRNMKRSFKDTSRLEPHLKITKTYKTPSDDGINNKVGFSGYLPMKEGTTGFKITIKNKKYFYEGKGVPIPLVIRAREYGSSSGEAKKPFFRKSFRKSEIEKEMLRVQKKYIKE